ncbi:MAG: DEAD/DEAH box helicase [Acidimicrobiales bacterium]|nr:DEAD/DEAH box helicase [Acidimicrobiales bacterium]
MSRSVSLRTWQHEALEAFTDRTRPSFLTVACPGAGKTTFALAAARQHFRGELLPLVVVVPTQHLKRQWAESAGRLGLHLDPGWSADSGRLPADMHGIVVTYAQAASSAGTLRAHCRDGFVILDEVHHAASDKTWGDGVERAFALAERRLLLSGTPFRTDHNPIPFVNYSFGDHGDAEPDYEYGYGEALESGGVVRPVFFPRFDGHMEWVNTDGDNVEGTFDDDLIKSEWGSRLRTALNLGGQWLPTVLGHAHDRLSHIRAKHPDAAGLVIAIDQEHARGIATMLAERHGVKAKVALSDDPKASDVIADFAAGDDEWVVAVRMISEGVDIPRLRVAVFATTTTTPMFFRQAVGRIARWTPGLRSQRAYMFLPDDPRLRHHANAIAVARRHSIEFRRKRLEESGLDDDPYRTARDEEQMSLFTAVSSTVLTDGPEGSGPADGLDPDEDLLGRPDDLEGHVVELPPPPPLPGQPGINGGVPAGLAGIRTRQQDKKDLRDFNAQRVRELVRSTGMTHAAINGELNRQAGIDRITEATVAQLRRRLEAADRWLDDAG